MKGNPKLRITYIAKMFFEETDENNFLTVPGIMQRLLDDYEIEATRQTVTDDLKELTNFGFEIFAAGGMPKRYYLGTRPFENSELKVLYDAVLSAQFISPKNSRRIIDSLVALGGPSARENLENSSDVLAYLRTDNDRTNYIIDSIYRAILEKKKISFRYQKLGDDMSKIVQNGGKPVLVSPFNIKRSGDFYYMVGLNEDIKDIRTYRIDRILSAPDILDKEKASLPPADFDMKKWNNPFARMYAGKVETVELLCKRDPEKKGNGPINGIFDKFGQNMTINKYDDEYIRITVSAHCDKAFFGWVAGFGGQVKILSPLSVKDEYKETLMAALEDE